MASQRQQQARAPGTLSNHRSEVALYLSFCSRLNIPPYQVSYHDICGYIEYLASHIRAPATIRNKISQIRTHFQLLDLPLSPFFHLRVTRALDALDRTKRHIPGVKLPLEPQDFYAILCALEKDPVGNLIRAVLLTMYFGVLRQSELIPRSVAAWDPEFQPTRGDVLLSEDRCIIYIKKGKNMQKYNQNRTIIMQAANNKLICPVNAMHVMFSETPPYLKSDPIFMFHDSRKPVPATYILKQLHHTMYRAGLDESVDQTSLHSIRKSAATDAYMAGCSEHSIKSYGGWSSSAYRVYIQTSNNRVNRSLINQLDLSAMYRSAA